MKLKIHEMWNKDKLKGVFDFVKNEEVKVVKEMTKEERLIELKGLYKKKLLTKDVYEGLVKDLLKCPTSEIFCLN